MIHLYCGDGKGKTTASVGLAIRALGAGKKVVMLQFLKDGSSNEVKILSKIDGFSLISGVNISKFTWEMEENELKNTKILQEKAFKKAINIKCDMLILDEICGAYTSDLIDKKLVEDFLNSDKTKDFEIVLTGRNPADFMLEKADYITEMKCIKHPFHKGINARNGIEF